MKPQDLEAIKAKLPLSDSTLARNQEVAADTIEFERDKRLLNAFHELDVSARPSTREQKLNNLERRRLAYLRRLNVPSLRIQAITLLIAEDCRYTADFTYLDCNGRMVFEDTKGPHVWEDSLIKMKTAAHQFTEFRFVLVREDRIGGWVAQEVKP